MYYYEEQKLGKWRPRTKPTRPSERGPEGEKLQLRAVTLVSESHRHLTLDQLFQVYSPEGTLQATGGSSSATDPRAEAIAECRRMLEGDKQSRMFGIDREMLELLVSR